MCLTLVSHWPGSVGEPREPLGGPDVVVVVVLLVVVVVVPRPPPPVQGLRLEGIPTGMILLLMMLMIMDYGLKFGFVLAQNARFCLGFQNAVTILQN